MSTNPSSIPVIERLQKVQQLYRDAFTATDDQALCLWIVEPAEVQFVEAFVLTEDSPGAVTRDLFLTFVGGDAGAKNYPEKLGAELHAQLTNAADSLIAQGVSAKLWECPPDIHTFPGFLTYVDALRGQLKKLRGQVVVYLHPTAFTDEAAFVLMVELAIEAGLPASIILMLHASEESLVSERLAGRSDWGVVTLHPNLQTATLANELAASGDPRDPAVRFRSLFLEFSQLGGQGAFGPMKEKALLAKKLAQQQAGWEHLVVTVLAAQGAHLLSYKAHRKEALDFFERAREAANLAINVGNPAGRASLLQTLNFEAAGLVQLKRYAAAATTYTEAAALAAEEESNRFHQMEALRMAAWCHSRDGNEEAAWEFNLAALSAASGLSPELLKGSTLPYAGRDLLRLIDQLNRHGETATIRDRLTGLIGNDWEELLHQAEQPAPA